MTILSRLTHRIVVGDGVRKTRMHTYGGYRIDLAGLRFLPHAVYTTLLVKLFGHWRPVPWLGYRAVRHLAGVLGPSDRVLEFGSGMSTVFFAERSAHVTSIESNPEWHERVGRILARERITNVTLLFREGEDHSDLDLRDFDFALVDGAERLAGAKAALRAVRPGGHILLDNSDAPNSDYLAARELLLAQGKDACFFRDLCPFIISVNESLMIRV